jgi:hypothetical protein
MTNHNNFTDVNKNQDHAVASALGMLNYQWSIKTNTALQPLSDMCTKSNAKIRGMLSSKSTSWVSKLPFPSKKLLQLAISRLSAPGRLFSARGSITGGARCFRVAFAAVRRGYAVATAYCLYLLPLLATPTYLLCPLAYMLLPLAASTYRVLPLTASAYRHAGMPHVAVGCVTEV